MGFRNTLGCVCLLRPGKKRKKDTLRESFATFDRSGEGLVSVSALVEILEHAGITDIEPEEVRG